MPIKREAKRAKARKRGSGQRWLAKGGDMRGDARFDAQEEKEFRRRFPQCVCSGPSNNTGPAQTIEFFGLGWRERCEAWEPLIVHWSEAEHERAVYILLRGAKGEIAEVHGSSCSWHDFEGSWSPEPMSREEMAHALRDGWLRASEDNPLRGAREAAARAAGLEIAQIDSRAKEAQKLLAGGASPIRKVRR
jgi:hypothetical protein